MSEAKHTPGPWLIRDGFKFDTIEIYPERDGPPDFGDWAELATVEADYGDDDGAEGVANARLIAAAPDLLAALRGAIEWMSCVEGHLRDAAPFKRNLATYQDAIAKATGSAP